MSKKAIIMTLTIAGMTLGSMTPLLWGGSSFGGWSIVLGMVGGVVGIWAGAKLARALN